MQLTLRSVFSAALCFAVCVVATSSRASWLSRDGVALTHWLDHDVAPYLSETLTQHPRFKGEPLRIVSMDGEALRVPSDRLSDDIAARLTEALLDVDGVNLVWSGHEPVGPCRRDPVVHYRLGIDVSELQHGQH